jgi:Lon protease-like protein
VTRRIPLFPLSTVLYPGLVMPLHIFEQRYRGLVQRLLAEPDGSPREFGVVAIREGREVGAEGLTVLHPIGCAASLRDVDPYDDGRYDITTVGTTRFRLLDVDTSAPLWEAEVEDLAESDGGDEDELQGLRGSVTRGFARYRAALQGVPDGAEDLLADPLGAGEELDAADDDLVDELEDAAVRESVALSVADSGVLSYAVAAAMILDLNDKQHLLATADTATRLREERRLLERERGLIRAIPSLPAVDLTHLPVSPN